jgi:hypothetical protein
MLALLLVVSFLGHDLLMAAEAVAATPAGGAHHAAAPAKSGATRAAPRHGDTPEHPENCRIGQSAIARSGDAFPHVDQNVASADASVCAVAALSSHASIQLWSEPRWPPGTRRAFLQVYRV